MRSHMSCCMPMTIAEAPTLIGTTAIIMRVVKSELLASVEIAIGARRSNEATMA